MPQSPPNPYPFLSLITDPHVQNATRFLQDQITQLKALQTGPVFGTLVPDTKPKGLGKGDAGTIFFAQDFNRRYRWTGSAWTDEPGQDPRNHQVLVDPTKTPIPQTGWLLCNGQTGLGSNPDGTVGYVQTPNIPPQNGQLTWIRV